MTKGKSINLKGKNGQRDAAKQWEKITGIKAKNGAQSGVKGGMDIESDINARLEVKRCETFYVYKAMDQADEDCSKNEVPVVMHRANYRPWVVCIKLKDIPKFVKAYNDAKLSE